MEQCTRRSEDAGTPVEAALDGCSGAKTAGQMFHVSGPRLRFLSGFEPSCLTSPVLIESPKLSWSLKGYDKPFQAQEVRAIIPGRSLQLF